jgi:hypothetical protein
MLQGEIDKLLLSGVRADDPEIKWRQRESAKLARELKEVRDYIDSVEPYIGTMLRLHYVRGYRWQYIAALHCGGNTQDSVRKQCHRYVLKDDEVRHAVYELRQKAWCDKEFGDDNEVLAELEKQMDERNYDHDRNGKTR